MPVAHYIGRGLKTEDEAKWILRARDIAIEETGYEGAGRVAQAGWTSNDHIGWGGLTARRPDGCHGDPISGFDKAGLPIYTMNVLPMTIEAENFDYFVVNGEGHTYSDAKAGNAGGAYRTDENVDIQVSTEGGHHITETDSGEYLTYTVYVPETGKYDVAIRYASENSSGKISVSFDGNNKTETVSLSSTGGAQNWQNLVLQKDVVLSQGVQSMKVNIVEGGFNIYSITIADDITAKVVESLINRNNNIAVRLQNNKRLFVSNAQDGEIQILNTLGKVIFSSHINSEQEIFDMNGMTNNVYIVQIRRNGNFWSTRNNIKGSGPD
jgi:hypothetical protein